MSPTLRTQNYLRERGLLIAKTEHYNWHAKVRVDLWGFVDTLALDPAPAAVSRVLAIQSTTHDHHSHRVTKILEHENTLTVLRHVEVEVWSWGKQGARGKKKEWTLRRTGFSFTGKRIITFDCSDSPLQ
jgi:hypothetical protein